jgi:hypothetical protein
MDDFGEARRVCRWLDAHTLEGGGTNHHTHGQEHTMSYLPYSASAMLVQALDGTGTGTLRDAVSAGIALVAVVILFTALRRVAQVVAALVAAAAAVGSVVLLVVVFFGLFAAALLLNVPV